MRIEGCEIEATGINYSICVRKRNYPFSIFSQLRTQRHIRQLPPENQEPKPEKFHYVLKDVSFRARPCEILAIVGPSGAGKSSLLEILAGRRSPDTASIFVNGQPYNRSRFRRMSGYVTQNDTLFPLLTVEETLMFSAKLQLRLPPEELRSRVKALIRELGLDGVAGVRVGDDRVRGISGGERRRVSIGVEAVHDPKVLILDEPTSGLDSTSALQIVDMLKIMSETRGRTVVLSIHQPGFRIVKLFSSILLLANGSVLHQGTVDQLGFRLSLIGLELPLHVNIIEFALESIDAIQELQKSEQSQRESLLSRQHFTLKQLFQQLKVVDEDAIEDYSFGQPPGFPNSRFREIAILIHRFWKNVLRTKELFTCRTAQMFIAGLVLGSIFYNLRDDLAGAEDKVGLFAFVLTFLLTSTIEALPVFLQEREILMKETSSGSYRVSSYAIANGLVYLPFLLILAVLFSLPLYWLVGLNPDFAAFAQFLLLIWLILYTANSVVVCFSALVPNFIVGNSVISGVMGSFFLFSGYFISKEEIPSYWIFMHYASLFKYPFEGLLINEFSGSGKCLEYMFGSCMVRGEDVLREEGGHGEDSRWKNLAIMACFIFFYRFASYVVLRFRCCSNNIV